MQKLSYQGVIKKMLERKLTSKEVDFLIYISRFQEENGLVRGVYYKDACKTLNMSYQTFYDVKVSLTQKKIIAPVKNDIDYDILILDNNYTISNPEEKELVLRKQYINTNHALFQNKDFFEMKAGAKLLILEFMHLTYNGRGSHRIKKDAFYNKYTKLFDISKRVLLLYLKKVKQYFSVGFKNGIVYITAKTNIYRQYMAKSEEANYRENIARMICRRERIKEFTNKSLEDTGTMLQQYKDSAKLIGTNIISLLSQAVHQSIKFLNQDKKEKRKWQRILKPRLIHKILKESLLYR